MTEGPITSNADLEVGMVVQIAVRLCDKRTGDPYWWKRFAAVTAIPDADSRWHSRHHLEATTLKLHFDPDKDVRTIDLRAFDQVVTILPKDRWPQGVSALWMKLVTLGHIKIGES